MNKIKMLNSFYLVNINKVYFHLRHTFSVYTLPVENVCQVKMKIECQLCGRVIGIPNDITYVCSQPYLQPYIAQVHSSNIVMSIHFLILSSGSYRQPLVWRTALAHSTYISVKTLYSLGRLLHLPVRQWCLALFQRAPSWMSCRACVTWCLPAMDTMWWWRVCPSQSRCVEGHPGPGGSIYRCRQEAGETKDGIYIYFLIRTDTSC